MPGRNSSTNHESITIQKGGNGLGEQKVTGSLGFTPEDEDEELREYIKNGLELRNELLFNHSAMSAAKQEYLTEYRRKRSQ
jgi:hypothetical protein